MRIDTHSVRLARKVLKAINGLVAKVPKGRNDLSLRHYQNGREHGFIVSNWPASNDKETFTRWVAFAENRNSDDIVVYSSALNRWASVPMQGMEDEAWKNRKCFRYDEVRKAAQFCVDHLLVK